MDAEDSRTIGRRLREVRFARGKSLRVVAGLAGISPSYLSRLESGERALDRRSLIVALANALQIAPSELTALPGPAPGDSDADAGIDAVRRALQVVDMGLADGQVQPVEQLGARVHAIGTARQACSYREMGAALPPLIEDLHTSLSAGRDDGDLLRLAVMLHVLGTQTYLHGVRAPADLRWAAASLAREAAERLAEAVSLGIAAFGMSNVLLGGGAFDLAGDVLRRAGVGPGDDPELAGMLALSASLAAAADNRPADVTAALEYATELAERTGEGNHYYMSFGPTNVTLWRIAATLESGDHEQAAALAETVAPERIPAPARKAGYWLNYGRALSKLRGRREDAVRALRRAEVISPEEVHRNPFARETLAELMARARRDAVGRELRGMAYRAGLPV